MGTAKGSKKYAVILDGKLYSASVVGDTLVSWRYYQREKERHNNMTHRRKKRGKKRLPPRTKMGRFRKTRRRKGRRT